jgi:type VI secretion system FHA domain protein
MYLTLEVVSPQAASLGARRRQVVGPKGLTIGRAPGNDWVIPDPYVSKQHARIVCTADRFFVEGLGRNPIAIGTADNTIPDSQLRPLGSGDRLFIDQYEILVTALAADPTRSAGDSGMDVACGIASVATAELDPLRALGDRSQSRQAALPPVNWQQASPLGDHYQPPPPAGAIPDNWSRSILMPRPPLSEGESATSPRLPPSQLQLRREPTSNLALPPASAQISAAGVDLAALLRAAGVSERDLSAEVAQELGKVLRVVVHGVMDVLQARAEIKAQFRLPLTRVQASENNPLKLSPNVESALHTLLVQRNPGYLPTVQAFEDAFADIRNHQLAMLEGVRVAFDTMLGAFDPQELAKDFDRSVKSRGLLGGLGAGSKYWDLYTERFGRFGKDADDTFRRLFGDAFADAYERQLERLKKDATHASHGHAREGMPWADGEQAKPAQKEEK